MGCNISVGLNIYEILQIKVTGLQMKYMKMINIVISKCHNLYLNYRVSQKKVYIRKSAFLGAEHI